MPPKKKAGRGGRFGRNGASSSSLSGSSQQGPGSSTRRSAAILASGNGNTPRASSGRNTQNSKGNRGSARKATTKKTPSSKPTNGRGRGRTGKKDSQLQSPPSYKAENGEVYKRGDFAFVDSQQPELPYHICVIRDFKMARKDSIIAEVKWFYRVSELPEAVYRLLMEDRKKCGEDSKLFENGSVRDRELFMAFNIDTHPASLFRGKCHVNKMSDVRDNLAMFLDKEDAFFYMYGYKPESRRLTLPSEDSYVPLSQQAVLPECRCSEESSGSSPPDVSSYYSSPPEEKVTVYEELVWKPEQTTDDQLLMYLRAARSIALHAGVCMNGDIADGYLAVSSDDTTQHAFDVLQRNNHDTEKALQELIKRPMVSQLLSKKNWRKESAVLFGKGMRQFGKNFFKIKKELLPDKEIRELAEYYYYWKKTSAGLSSRSTRRQRKMTHIRLSRAPLKPLETTPEKEFMDWESCDEEEAELDDTDKAKARSFYACRHCFSQSSNNWHHAGPDKTILCQECRLYFQRYGCMMPITDKRQPPEFLFKEYHDSTIGSEDNPSPPAAVGLQTTPNSGRKTRNSNGSRGGGSLRPGLRSAKANFLKSDTDEDEEGDGSGDSCCESSGEDEVVHKPKPLQARRSILDLDSKQTEEPPAKRAKREDTVSTLSEEEGSVESTNGEGEVDGSQKSPNGGEKSPGQSSSTSSANADDEEGSPCSSQMDPTLSSVPQQFRREAKSSDSTCARTDLVYVHPPAEEKKMATQTSKVMPNLPGPSNIVRGIGEVSSSEKLSKPPLITQYAPQLPIGPPGPPTLFPPFAPVTPHGGPPVQDVAGHHHKQEQEEQQQQQLALWQQHHQQQQWVLQLKQLAEQQQQQQQQLHQLIIPPGSAHHHAPFPMPVVTSHGHATHSTEPMAFTFNPEEVAAVMRPGGGGTAARVGLPGSIEHLAAAGIIPPGQQIIQSTPIPFLDSYQLAMSGRLQEEHTAAAAAAAMAGGGLIPLIQAGVPASVEQQQLMLAQQQQQVFTHVAAINNMGLHEFVDFLRQTEVLAVQIQKEPAILQDPNVQLAMKRREVLIQQIQSAAIQMEQFQRMQQEAILQQQHQQHQELLQKQQQFILTRPPLPEEVHSRNRPGVIVGHK